MNFVDLSSNWEVMQDVYEIGELAGVPSDDWDPARFGPKRAALSEWEPIPYLSHLQLLLSDSPYYGRALRYFNEHPWWYRKTFELSEADDGGATGARLVFSNADYFARVWLNGTCLGDHEGYFAPFSFEVGESVVTGVINSFVLRDSINRIMRMCQQ